MPSLINRPLAAVVILFSSAAQAAAPPFFSVLSDDPGAWPAILSSIGLQSQPAALASYVTLNLLRGAYLVNEYNPRPPKFTDLRAGFCYAFSH